MWPDDVEKPLPMWTGVGCILLGEDRGGHQLPKNKLGEYKGFWKRPGDDEFQGKVLLTKKSVMSMEVTVHTAWERRRATWLGLDDSELICARGHPTV